MRIFRWRRRPAPCPDTTGPATIYTRRAGALDTPEARAQAVRWYDEPTQIVPAVRVTLGQQRVYRVDGDPQ